MSKLHMNEVHMHADTAKMHELAIAASNVGVDRAADVLVKFIKQSFVKTSKFTSSPAGGPPGIRDGALRRSIQYGRPAEGKVQIFTNWLYAAIQEYGGVIRAKRKKYLTIPVSFAAERMRKNTADLRTQNLTFRPGKHRGVATLWQTVGKGKNSRSELMFVLKPTVRLPARPFMRPAAQNPDVISKMGTSFTQGFLATIRKAFTKGRKIAS
jgi:phage gpG-like protein